MAEYVSREHFEEFVKRMEGVSTISTSRCWISEPRCDR